MKIKNLGLYGIEVFAVGVVQTIDYDAPSRGSASLK
jgi:hypothetical protein